jgi:hypothetical protein
MPKFLPLHPTLAAGVVPLGVSSCRCHWFGMWWTEVPTDGTNCGVTPSLSPSQGP